MTQPSPNTTADRRCPIDGAPVAVEKLDEFFICSRCREVLTEAETVSRASRETQKTYLDATYPGGYDRPINRLPSEKSLWERWVALWRSAMPTRGF